MQAWSIAVIAAAIVISGYFLSSAAAQTSNPLVVVGSEGAVALYSLSTGKLTTCRIGADGSALCKQQVLKP
ncbi:hypothetical protein FHX16_003966 [Rhizobium sp. BK661]|nr:hypothetical protein [Rhizobium sp. BK661]